MELSLKVHRITLYLIYFGSPYKKDFYAMIYLNANDNATAN